MYVIHKKWHFINMFHVTVFVLLFKKKNQKYNKSRSALITSYTIIFKLIQRESRNIEIGHSSSTAGAPTPLKGHLLLCVASQIRNLPVWQDLLEYLPYGECLATCSSFLWAITVLFKAKIFKPYPPFIIFFPAAI